MATILDYAAYMELADMDPYKSVSLSKGKLAQEIPTLTTSIESLLEHSEELVTITMDNIREILKDPLVKGTHLFKKTTTTRKRIYNTLERGVEKDKPLVKKGKAGFLGGIPYTRTDDGGKLVRGTSNEWTTYLTRYFLEQLLEEHGPKTRQLLEKKYSKLWEHIQTRYKHVIRDLTDKVNIQANQE